MSLGTSSQPSRRWPSVVWVRATCITPLVLSRPQIGSIDETDPEFWRCVMERAHPPRAHLPLRPRTRAEVLAIMGEDYKPIGPLPR